MRTITTILLDETETDTLSRVAPLLPLAYPTSNEPAHLRPAHIRPVDVRDPRLRILPRLAEQPRLPITYPQAALAHEVLSRLVEVLEPQTTPQWWLDLLQGRTVRTEDEQMAQTMAAERAGQLPRALAAAQVVATALEALSPADDPMHGVDGEV